MLSRMVKSTKGVSQGKRDMQCHTRPVAGKYPYQLYAHLDQLKLSGYFLNGLAIL